MVRRRNTGYRGRFAARRATRRLMLALTGVLLVVVVALGVGQRWVIYTDEGVRFQPPFLPLSGSAPQKVDVTIQVQAGVTMPDPITQTTSRTRAVWLSAQALERDGLQAVEAVGADTVVLDMKTPEGRLNYISYQSLAALGNGDSDRVISLLGQLCSEGVRTVACMSCFRDDLLAEQVGGWLDNADETVDSYLSGVTAELARMGFDEILLEHWQTPGASQTQTEAFLHRMEQALEDTGAVLSVLTSGDAPGTLSGRIWSDTERQGEEWVLLTAAFDPDGPAHQAIR